MAYSHLQQFYKYHQQEKLIVYLNRRGLRCERIACLQWSELRGRNGKVAGKVRLPNAMRFKMNRLNYQRQRTSGRPLEYLFYREMPTAERPYGEPFTKQEIWEICGQPKERGLTKAKIFGRMKVA